MSKIVKIPGNMQPWKCSINGVEYSYPSGTGEWWDVPDEVAVVIEQYYNNQPKPQVTIPPFGGGGSKPFIVVENYDTYENSANMTFDELKNAIENDDFPSGWYHTEGQNAYNEAFRIIGYTLYKGGDIHFYVMSKWGNETHTWAYRRDGTIEPMGGDG